MLDAEYTDKEMEVMVEGANLFELMPVEIKTLILNFLTEPKDLASVSLVCKDWCFVLDRAKTWRSLIVKVPLSGEIPAKRVCHICQLLNGIVYIHGGHTPGKRPHYVISEVHADMFALDIEKRVAVKLDISLPRTEHSSVLFEDRMYFFGGYGKGSYTAELYCYDPRKNEISCVSQTPTAIEGRSAHTAVVWKNSMYVYGGWDGRASKGEFFRFNFGDETWDILEKKGSAVPPALRSHSAVAYKDAMYVVGGFGATHPEEVFKYDFVTEEWSIFQVNGTKRPCGRSRSRAILHGSSIIVYGGWDRISHFNDMWELDLERAVWNEVKITHTEVPEGGLGQHSLVVVKGILYIWGGFNGKLEEAENAMYAHPL